MSAASTCSIEIGGRRVDFRLVSSKSARRLRVRVGVSGIEVVQPAMREAEEVTSFLRSNEAWIIEQLERVERFRAVRRPRKTRSAEILYKGEPTTIEVREIAHREGANRVILEGGRIVILRGIASRTPAARSLENWLRKQARGEIEKQLDVLTVKLKRRPRKVYVRGQRTKWGACSSRRNLSFNWRLIMAPSYVLRYLVTHEVTHLAIPDHSKKFWLTVKSMCPETERAKQWLSVHGHSLLSDSLLP
jgi:predicted metal-dependent hydrolase